MSGPRRHVSYTSVDATLDDFASSDPPMQACLERARLAAIREERFAVSGMADSISDVSTLAAKRKQEQIDEVAVQTYAKGLMARPGS